MFRLYKTLIAPLLFVFLGRALHAQYGLAGLLPGEAVDPVTDLTEFSFSVPHPVKGAGFVVSPGYDYSSHSHSVAQPRHRGGGSLFGYIQLENLRLGAVTKNTVTKAAAAPTDWRQNSRAMASYFLPFMSFGAEVGGFHATGDSPEDRWGATGALSVSIYGSAWAIDTVARVFRPNASFAAPDPFPYIFERTGYLFSLPGSELYAARFRYDWSYTWRMVLSGKVLACSDLDYYAGSGIWRYRSGFLQLLTGANYSQAFLYNGSRYTDLLGVVQVNWPVYLILEHAKSVFYIGGSAPVFYGVATKTDAAISSVFSFQPQVAYTYRFSGKWWAGFTVASQSMRFYKDQYMAEIQREFHISFQVVHNLLPFGMDDEVPFADGTLLAARH